MNRDIAIKKATALVDQMTVEEMASQLRFDAPAIERLGIPAYNWWNEGLHGVARSGTATIFPQAIGLGATFDEALLRDIADAISTEARAKYNQSIREGDRDIYKGLTLWSPNVNIFRDPRWGRGHETYGEDPYLTGRLGVSFIKGLQGEGEYLKTAACTKHFAVHSGPEAKRHYFDAKISKKEMWETYLPAFEACVREANVEAVMGAYNRTNGEACCAHDYLMNTVLREQWGFQGHYVSDCWAVRDFHEQHKITAAPEDSVTLALSMGCDLNCGCTYQRILNAYEEKKLPLEHIRRSAIRLFATRYLLGMFDETEYDTIPYTAVECKEHLALTEKAARESIVLLKNDGILPLKKEKIKTLGVIGPNANSRAALIGNYHGTASRYVTVLEGIQQQAGEDIRVLYSQGCHLFRDREEPLAVADDRLAEARTVCRHSDLVILCLGLDETLEGEEGDTGNAYASGDKQDLRLPQSQQNLLKAVIETGVPFVVCMMAGSAMDLNLSDEHACAVLQTFYPGALGGRAVADILFGAASPSGKLPITLYRDLNGMPDFEDYRMAGRTYRFLRQPPLYPFGYGLHYGKTEVVCVTTDTTSYSDAAQHGIQVTVTAENQGDMAVEDVLQVYVRVGNSKNEVPNPRLAAFRRVHLAPGETKTVTLCVDARAFGTIDSDGKTVFDGSGAAVCVGFGQPDERTAELTGKRPCRIYLQ